MGSSGSTNAFKEIRFQQSSASYDVPEKYITPRNFGSGVFFLVCELWYYYNVMIFQKVKREI